MDENFTFLCPKLTKWMGYEIHLQLCTTTNRIWATALSRSSSQDYISQQPQQVFIPQYLPMEFLIRLPMSYYHYYIMEYQTYYSHMSWNNDVLWREFQIRQQIHRDHNIAKQEEDFDEPRHFFLVLSIYEVTFISIFVFKHLLSIFMYYLYFKIFVLSQYSVFQYDICLES